MGRIGEDGGLRREMGIAIVLLLLISNINLKEFPNLKKNLLLLKIMKKLLSIIFHSNLFQLHTLSLIHLVFSLRLKMVTFTTLVIGK